MNSSGVFCKPKSSTEIYNNILADEYSKCIFGETETLIDIDLPSGSKPIEEAEWEVGKNVRAPFYLNDEEYYEAKILKVFDDEFALVEYLGYEDRKVVRLDELLDSLGKIMIEEQIERAKLEYEEYEEEEEDNEEPIDWKIGMPCRAYYEPMDLIYEATVQALDSTNEKATVLMTGYDITYTVDTCDLYRSDSLLRKSQIKRAVEWKNSSDVTQAPKQFSNSIPDPKITVQNSQPVNCNHNSSKVHAGQSLSSSITNTPHHQQRIIQPKDENEAIACLVSAKYLCGYYAGYYDCLKSNKPRKQPDV